MKRDARIGLAVVLVLGLAVTLLVGRALKYKRGATDAAHWSTVKKLRAATRRPAPIRTAISPTPARPRLIRPPTLLHPGHRQWAFRRHRFARA